MNNVINLLKFHTSLRSTDSINLPFHTVQHNFSQSATGLQLEVKINKTLDAHNEFKLVGNISTSSTYIISSSSTPSRSCNRHNITCNPRSEIGYVQSTWANTKYKNQGTFTSYTLLCTRITMVSYSSNSLYKL